MPCDCRQISLPDDWPRSIAVPGTQYHKMAPRRGGFAHDAQRRERVFSRSLPPPALPLERNFLANYRTISKYPRSCVNRTNPWPWRILFRNLKFFGKMAIKSVDFIFLKLFLALKFNQIIQRNGSHGIRNWENWDLKSLLLILIWVSSYFPQTIPENSDSKPRALPSIFSKISQKTER